MNETFGAKEKLQLLSIDHVVSWARAWLSSVSEDRTYEILDSEGMKWQTEINNEWSVEDWKDMVGRVADLANAYKQVPACPSDASFGIIAVQDPNLGKVKLFKALSLMFGETAAVYGFIRFSRALSALGARLFDLVIVEFFDDLT